MSSWESIQIKFEIRVVDAQVQQSQDQQHFLVSWARGSKSVETKKKALIGGKVVFNEKFEMKTMVECNPERTVFRPKPSELRLVQVGDQQVQNQIVGKIPLNIGDYAKGVDKEIRMELENSMY